MIVVKVTSTFILRNRRMWWYLEVPQTSLRDLSRDLNRGSVFCERLWINLSAEERDTVEIQRRDEFVLTLNAVSHIENADKKFIEYAD